MTKVMCQIGIHNIYEELVSPTLERLPSPENYLGLTAKILDSDLPLEIKAKQVWLLNNPTYVVKEPMKSILRCKHCDFLRVEILDD